MQNDVENTLCEIRLVLACLQRAAALLHLTTIPAWQHAIPRDLEPPPLPRSSWLKGPPEIVRASEGEAMC